MTLFDPEFKSLSSGELTALDRLCGEFERQRLAGEDCAIEQFLARSPSGIRAQLTEELIRIEVEICRDWDEPVDCQQYAERFPEHTTFIHKLFSDTSLQSNIGSQFTLWRSTPHVHRDGSETLLELNGADKTSSELTHLLEIDDSQNLSPSSRFHITRNLATGGIGTVYVGIDRDLDREVAVKVLKRKFASNPITLARFRTEATITSHLEHPNIVPVYAIGVRRDGLPFYAMRLVRGRSLQQAINELHTTYGGLQFRVREFRRIPAARDLLMRFITACRAAAFAHSRGIIHRDIKPSNIMVDDYGETLLVDWGLAIDTNPPRGEAIEAKSVTRQIIGTLGYMSPEQAAGEIAALNCRSDIYSLGATLVTLLTKQVPRSHLSTELNTNVAIQEGKRVTGHENSGWYDAGNLPLELQAIIDKSLQETPEARYETAGQLADDLESWLADEPVSVCRDSWLTRSRRWMREHPTVSGGIFAGAATLSFGLMLGTLLLANQNETLRQANQREQAAVKIAQAHATQAELNAAEATRQRERVLSVLNRFLMDVERGLTNVPGGAKVQRNVLVTVLNELETISQDFSNARDADYSNAVALLDLAALFARVGHSDAVLSSKAAELGNGTPLEVAERLAAEAWNVAQRIKSESSVELRDLRAQILERQADILRQTGRGEIALQRLNESLALRREIEALNPPSTELAIAYIGTLDQIGQHYLQDKQLDLAEQFFSETYQRAVDLNSQMPDQVPVLRALAISCSRRGDLAHANGDLNVAERWFDEDRRLTEKIYESNPENALAMRDLAVSLDRLGRTRENRGRLEEAIQAWEEARQLRTELRDAEPNDFQANRELFVSNFKLGATKMLLKQFEDAKRYYRQADELAQQMAALDKSNATVKRYQSMCAEAMCDILLSESKPDEALPFALLSLKIMNELAARSPLDATVQRDWFVLQTKIAKVHKLRGDFPSCLEVLETLLKTVEDSMSTSNRSLASLKDYSSVLLRLGDACLAADQSALAVDYFQRMLDNEASMPAGKRGDADSRRMLVNAQSMLGQALINVGKIQEAQTTLIKARDLAQQMIDDQMRTEQMKDDLLEIERLLEQCSPLIEPKAEKRFP